MKLTALMTFLLCITFAGSSLWVPEFDGFNAEQFPVPQADPPVQPAGYAFAIWALIYIWLLAGMGFGLLHRSTDARWHGMRRPLIVSLSVGSVWLPVAVLSPVWASILIWIMLVSALVALFRAPLSDKAWGLLPIGLYTGWLSAAACVSLGLLAAGYGIAQPPVAAFGTIFGALVLASAVQNQLPHAQTFTLAVLWALIAIVVRNLGTDPTIAAIAGGGAIALAYSAWRTLRAV